MTPADAARRLARLARVREAERSQAMARLAEGCAAHARLSTLADRARAMASGGGAGHPTDAGTLRAVLNFGCRVWALAATAERQAAEADRQVLAARQALAAAGKRLDLTRQRQAAAKREAAAARDALS